MRWWCMRLIIAGSRTLKVPYDLVDLLVEQFSLSPTEIVSGGAKGIDKCAEEYGDYLQGIATKKVFPADWNAHGKAAGPIRNKQMAEYADALLLIWDGTSVGSANMKYNMAKLGKPIYEVILKAPVKESDPDL